MIKVVIFDLDGTLIQTELLKAKSYARAVHLLSNRIVSERIVMEDYKKYLGLSRKEVLEGLVDVFRQALLVAFPHSDDTTLQQLVLRRRLEIYNAFLTNHTLMSKFFCPYCKNLLHALHTDGFQTALATMSHRTEVDQVLDIMHIRDQLNAILTRDNVSKGKPDPEIYLALKDIFKVQASECLVIEDSVNGIKAALNAGMPVFGAVNNITKESVHAANLLPEEFIVDDLTQLEARVYGFLKGEYSSI